MGKCLQWSVLTAVCCACMLILTAVVPSAARVERDLILHLEDGYGNVISDAQVVVITPEGDHLKTVQLPAGTYAYYGVGGKITLEIEHETLGTTLIDMTLPEEAVRKGQVSDGAMVHRTVVLGEVMIDRALNGVGPPNDLCENAIPVAVPSLTSGTTTDATIDGVELCGTAESTSPGVWYSVIGTGTTITAETCTGTSWDTKISVFCHSCNDLACVDGNDDDCGLQSSVSWCSEFGIEYLVLVHGYGGQTGDFELMISDDGSPCDPDVLCAVVPENDLCDDATPVAIPSVTPGTTWGATFDDIEFCGTSNTAPGVWYSALGTGTTITAETCAGSVYDTKITVFCGACGDLTCVDGSDDDCALQSSVSWCSQMDAEYFILVHGFGSATGDFEITLSDDGQPCIADGACIPTGACCLPDASCAGGLTQGECEAEGGLYQGDDTVCAGGFLGWNAFEDCANPFEDISGTGIELFLGDDAGEVVPIGFTFNFWGDDHADIAVCSNGYLTFGIDLTDFSNDLIPDANDPNDFIAPLWDDLSPNQGGTVHYQTLGAEPNRRFIAQWTEVPQFVVGDQNTFQAILFEGTNCIEFHYGVITPDSPVGDYGIGIENQDGTEGYSFPGDTVSEGDCKSICPVYIDAVVCAVDVPFDIKPTSCPNPLNTKSNGVLPVAILGTNDFDVTEVDPSSVTLEGVSPLRWAYEDVTTPVGPMANVCDCTEDGPDGYLDMTLKFSTPEIVTALGAVIDGEYRPLTLMGETYDGTPISGQDCVWIKNKGSNPGGRPPVISIGNFTGEATTIHLSLSEAAEVSMVVYDVRGKSVKTVVNGTLQSGDHRIPWNGRDDADNSVANGVYFCRVKAGTVEKTVKMLLVD